MASLEMFVRQLAAEAAHSMLEKTGIHEMLDARPY